PVSGCKGSTWGLSIAFEIAVEEDNCKLQNAKCKLQNEKRFAICNLQFAICNLQSGAGTPHERASHRAVPGLDRGTTVRRRGLVPPSPPGRRSSLVGGRPAAPGRALPGDRAGGRGARHSRRAGTAAGRRPADRPFPAGAVSPVSELPTV